MASIVGAAVEETRAAGSKKMTPYHLFVVPLPALLVQSNSELTASHICSPISQQANGPQHAHV